MFIYIQNNQIRKFSKHPPKSTIQEFHKTTFPTFHPSFAPSYAKSSSTALCSHLLNVASTSQHHKGNPAENGASGRRSEECKVFFKSKTEKSKLDILKCPFLKNGGRLLKKTLKITLRP